MEQCWAHPIAEPPNSHSESSDGAKVPRVPAAEPGRDGEQHRAAPYPLPMSRMSRRGCEEPLKAAGLTGDRAEKREAKTASPSKVLPSTIPASEPCSQPRVLLASGDNAASPAHLGPSQHLTQPHDFRSSTQTDFHPWRQQRQPGRAGRGPSTLAKHQPPRKGLTVPPGAAPAEVPVPCSMLPGSAGIRRLSLLRAQWEGRSCGSARF